MLDKEIKKTKEFLPVNGLTARKTFCVGRRLLVVGVSFLLSLVNPFTGPRTLLLLYALKFTGFN